MKKPYHALEKQIDKLKSQLKKNRSNKYWAGRYRTLNDDLGRLNTRYKKLKAKYDNLKKELNHA